MALGRPLYGAGPATSWHWAGHVILSRACSVKKNAAPDEADVQRTGVARRRLQRSRAIHRCSTQADDPFELHMDTPERSGKAGRIAAQHGTHVVQRPAATLQ